MTIGGRTVGTHRSQGHAQGSPRPTGDGAGEGLLPALAELPGHLLWRAAGRVSAALADVLPPGVDLNAYAVLLVLDDGGPRSQQELADAIAVSGTTLMKVAAALTDQGLVERVRNPRDRRSWSLTSTPTGRAAERAWREHAEAVEAEVTAAFTTAERDELRDLLARVAASDLSEHVPPALRDSTGFLVSRIHLRVHREVVHALAPVGIEPRHFAALTALTATGPVPQAELARHLGLSPASLVGIVDDLEERGLVERRRPAHDRRTQVLHLLPGADEVREQAARTIAASDVLAPLGADDRRRTMVLLRRLVTA